jgi:lysophospholipid acyltransferase (LPLAT)-like uncharacterized protein
MTVPKKGTISPDVKRVAPIVQSPLLKFCLLPLCLVYRLWTRSIRIRYEPCDGSLELEKLQEPMTLVLWHNRLFYAGEWLLRFRKRRRCYGLISGSKDGAWLETFYGWAGIRAIRGSRNKRGFQATRDLIRLVKEGHDAGITPDGSRGPKYQAKSGALLVARASRSPVVLLDFTYSRAIRLKSWDEFVIPLPFSQIRASTKVLRYADLFKDRDLEQARKRMEKCLMEMTDDTI